MPGPKLASECQAQTENIQAVLVRIQRRLEQELQAWRDLEVLRELKSPETLDHRLVAQRTIRRATPVDRQTGDIQPSTKINLFTKSLISSRLINPATLQRHDRPHTDDPDTALSGLVGRVDQQLKVRQQREVFGELKFI